MLLAVNVIDRRGPSNEMRHQLQSKNKVRQQKKFYSSFISNKTEHINFKSGCVIQVVKHLYGDWFIVLC